MTPFVAQYPSSIGTLQENFDAITKSLPAIQHSIGHLIPHDQKQGPLKIDGNPITWQRSANRFVFAINIICSIGSILCMGLAISLNISLFGIPSAICAITTLAGIVYLLCQSPDLEHPKTRLELVHELGNSPFSLIMNKLEDLSLDTDDAIGYALLGSLPKVSNMAYAALSYFGQLYHKLQEDFRAAKQDIINEYNIVLSPSKYGKIDPERFSPIKGDSGTTSPSFGMQRTTQSKAAKTKQEKLGLITKIYSNCIEELDSQFRKISNG